MTVEPNDEDELEADGHEDGNGTATAEADLEDLDEDPAPTPAPRIRDRVVAGRKRRERKSRAPRHARVATDATDPAPAFDAAAGEADDGSARILELERELAEARKKLEAAEEPRKKARRAAPVTEPEPDAEDDLPIKDEGEDGPTPIELVVPDTSPFARVERKEARSANGGSDYVGFLGIVPHKWGFEEVIRQRWGGGTYEVTCVVKGKKITRPLPLGGPSLPPDEEQRRAAEADVYDQWQQQHPGVGYEGAGPYGYDQGGRPAGFQSQAPWAEPAGSGGWAQGPSGQWVQQPGWDPRNPASAMASAFSAPRPYNDTEAGHAAKLREDQMREDLDATRLDAMRAREELRMAQFGGAAQLREESFKRELDTIKSKLEQGPPGGGIADFMKLMFQAQDQRAREEAQSRQTRLEEDRIAREEARAREEKRAHDDGVRWERERKERLDREEAERKTRSEQRHEELERRDRERRDEEKRFERMQASLVANQQKPADTLELMVKMKELSGGDDAVDKVLKIVEASHAMREALGVDGNGGEEGTADKVVKVVKGVGDALAPAVGEFAKFLREQREADRARQQPINAGQVHVVSQPAGALPTRAEPQAQSESVAPSEETRINGLTARQWGKVLEHVVDQFTAKVDPSEAARDLLLVLKAIDGMPGLEKIANSTPEGLRVRVNLLRASGKVSEGRATWYMDSFVQNACAGKAEWMGKFLVATKRYYDGLLARARAQEAQAQAKAKAETEAKAKAEAGEAEAESSEAEEQEAEEAGGDDPPA